MIKIVIEFNTTEELNNMTSTKLESSNDKTFIPSLIKTQE